MILRNVAINSRVLFAQFIGRALRATASDNGIHAKVISHIRYKQGENFHQLNDIANVEVKDDSDGDDVIMSDEFCIEDL